MEEVELFFDAIGNKNRFRILNELLKNDMCPRELEKKLGIKQTNLSHDLKCLVNCRFVNVKKIGRNRFYSITPQTKRIIIDINKHIKSYSSYLTHCKILGDKYGKV